MEDEKEMTDEQRTAITDFINSVYGKPVVFGERDCNLTVMFIIDVMTGSNYYSTMKGTYTTIEEGIAKAKDLIGMTPSAFMKKHFTKTDSLEDGVITSSIKKNKTTNVYHTGVYFSGVILVADENNIFTTVHQIDTEYQDLWRVK